jgi:hypothetical protein
VVNLSAARRRAAALAAVVAVSLPACLAGCGAPDDETVPPVVTTTVAPAPPTDLVDLPVGTAAVAPGDRVRARDSVLTVDGRTVDLAPLRVDDFVVVRGGIFFRNGTELWFTDLGRAQGTGYTDVRSLVVSPDGRRIAFVDLEHGPKDSDGTPLAISIAYDATTGKALVASYVGMGDLTQDHLAARYRAEPPRVLGFDGDDLLVHGTTGKDYRVPLGASAATSTG